MWRVPLGCSDLKHKFNSYTPLRGLAIKYERLKGDEAIQQKEAECLSSHWNRAVQPGISTMDLLGVRSKPFLWYATETGDTSVTATSINKP